MLKYRKTNRNVEAVMKRIIINILSLSLCALMLLSMCSCAVLDKLKGNIEEKPEDETTKEQDNVVVPTVKYPRNNMKYTFLTVVEGFEEGAPAQISYAVFDTKANTLSSMQIPVNTFINGANKTLGDDFKARYTSKSSEGRDVAVKYAVESLMAKLKDDLMLVCDYYIYFDKTSMSDLANNLEGVEVQVPFEMRFTDGTLIRSGKTELKNDQLWKVMSYNSYAFGSELNAAKMLFASTFYRMREAVTPELISLFIMNVRSNLYTNIPKTNGVDVFFFRKLISLDVESYKFSSADTQYVVEGNSQIAVICKDALLKKINSFLAIYENEIEIADFDQGLAFCDTSSMIISGAYNSIAAISTEYTASEAKNGGVYIFSK